jgi:hypothetical protein
MSWPWLIRCARRTSHRMWNAMGPVSPPGPLSTTRSRLAPSPSPSPSGSGGAPSPSAPRMACRASNLGGHEGRIRHRTSFVSLMLLAKMSGLGY